MTGLKHLNPDIILQMLSLSEVVGTPSHTGPSGDSSLIDLALISNVALLLYCSTVPPLANSNHNGLELSFKWRQSDRQVQEKSGGIEMLTSEWHAQ